MLIGRCTGSGSAGIEHAASCGSQQDPDQMGCTVQWLDLHRASRTKKRERTFSTCSGKVTQTTKTNPLTMKTDHEDQPTDHKD
ncbi:hypothetical protein EYF80_047383 [Liparis tanakae]|uniref:Uncharacterized protein n=1 Tax=Liparis tanakae TaxID=230148 RepID=A0A4Z2FMT0_9TELE|nr:hypothetical protein EYF80_047383 [Liparis tanakae]